MRKTVADRNRNELCRNRNELCGERGMRMTEHGMAVGNGNGLCGNGSREWEWALRGGGNVNGRTRNGSLPLTALISSRDLALIETRDWVAGGT
jgi:hypothetical protein